MNAMCCLVGSIVVFLMCATSNPSSRTVTDQGHEAQAVQLQSENTKKAHCDTLTTTFIEMDFDPMEASRLAVIVVYGEDPDLSPVQTMDGETCYWVNVTVFYCDSAGEMKSKTLHIGRACWNALIATINAPCAQPICSAGQVKALKFSLVSGCDSDIGTSCVVIKDGGWWPQHDPCDSAPSLEKCAACFPTNLCGTLTCVPWTGDAPTGCPSCSD